MKEITALVLEDDICVQEYMGKVVSYRIPKTKVTASPSEALESIAQLYFIDHNLGADRTGDDVARDLRAMYGDTIYIASTSADLPYDVDKSTYNIIIPKGNYERTVFMALADFEEWYKGR